MDLSSFVFSWGQFVDHDITHIEVNDAEPAPISVPANDLFFTTDIHFDRSVVHPGTGVNAPREQTNSISSWMDASMVYGSDEGRANWLRTFSQGKLKTSANDLLPFNTVTGEYADPIDPNAPHMAGDESGNAKVFVAGDNRANEQAGLTAMHTLFVREHNRICDELISLGYSVDEEIYQIARKWVGAIIQNITYQEFLPALGVQLTPYFGYNPDILPDISNTFAAAAYRLGHTMISDNLLLYDNQCNPIAGGSLSLVEAFFNITHIQTHGI